MREIHGIIEDHDEGASALGWKVKRFFSGAFQVLQSCVCLVACVLLARFFLWLRCPRLNGTTFVTRLSAGRASQDVHFLCLYSGSDSERNGRLRTLCMQYGDGFKTS